MLTGTMSMGNSTDKREGVTLMRERALLKLIVSGALLSVSASAVADNAREIERANEILLEVSQAYSRFPALTDEIATHFSMDGRPDEKSTIVVRLSKNAAEATGIVPPNSLDVHAIDGQLYLQLKSVEGAVETELGDDPLASAKNVMGIAYPYLPPQIVLRWAKGIDGAGDWFTFGMLENSVVAGYALIAMENGEKRHEILFKGFAPILDRRPGTCRLQIDTETNLVTDIVIKGGIDGTDPTFSMTAGFKPKILKQLETPIVLDLGDGFIQHTNFMAMLSVSLGGGVSIDPSIEVGAIAPEFELIDQNGVMHKSSAYRGKILILDWWGVWCLACKQDLPKLQKMHEKYADNPNVVILALNVRDENERMARYWADMQYTFPTLNDADELVDKYGIKAYPSAILIGPDGRVLRTAVGSASDLAEDIDTTLKTIK